MYTHMYVVYAQICEHTCLSPCVYLLEELELCTQVSELSGL